MEKSRVGIITPSFNQHPFLSQAIDSVLAQTHKDFVYFIVNDYASRSDAEGVRNDLDSLVRNKGDDRIRVSHNETNLGISKSRNSAILKAIEQGLEYVFFLDHDDLWNDSDKIKNQLNVLSRGEIGLLGTQFDIINDVNTIIGKSSTPIEHDTIKKLMLLSCPILISSMGVNMQVFTRSGFFLRDIMDLMIGNYYT